MYDQEKIKPYSAEGRKGEQVAAMFDSIAHSYDLLNHTLSFGIDKLWRRRAINSLKKFRPRHILDVATGTGDFAILAAKKLHPESLTGIDISEGMLEIGWKKAEEKGLSGIISFNKGDCMNLPFADDTFDAVTVAYGVRNFESLDCGLKEMLRVTKPGGRLVIIELTTPQSFPMKQLFSIYSHILLPMIGKAISHDKSAYDYLPATMQAFPHGPQMKSILERAGFRNVRFHYSFFGINTFYEAEK